MFVLDCLSSIGSKTNFLSNFAQDKLAVSLLGCLYVLCLGIPREVCLLPPIHLQAQEKQQWEWKLILKFNFSQCLHEVILQFLSHISGLLAGFYGKSSIHYDWSCDCHLSWRQESGDSFASFYLSNRLFSTAVKTFLGSTTTFTWKFLLSWHTCEGWQVICSIYFCSYWTFGIFLKHWLNILENTQDFVSCH